MPKLLQNLTKDAYYIDYMDLNGKQIALQIHEELKEEVGKLKPAPFLVAVLVGDNPASHLYVNNKMLACNKVGIRSACKHFPKSLTEEKLLTIINELNHDPHVTGILVQLPLPTHIDPLHIAQAIAPEKDVDGIHPLNYGKLLMGDPSALVPCTPLGIQQLLLRSGIETSGKHVVIAGRSNIVGKPLAALLLQRGKGANATVTVMHKDSHNSALLTVQADILVAAIGKPHFFTKEMIKKGAVVIDVGQNRIPAKKGHRVVGDVDYEGVHEHAAYITPVPGGVGPMTIAMLLQNSVKAYKNQR